MYHDQGLIPFKTLAFGKGVNLLRSLPFIRTSPDHGTAFEIAGENKANEKSFREAVFTACDIYKKRQEFNEIHENPLPDKRRNNINRLPNDLNKKKKKALFSIIFITFARSF